MNQAYCQICGGPAEYCDGCGADYVDLQGEPIIEEEPRKSETDILKALDFAFGKILGERK